MPAMVTEACKATQRDRKYFKEEQEERRNAIDYVLTGSAAHRVSGAAALPSKKRLVIMQEIVSELSESLRDREVMLTKRLEDSAGPLAI